MSRRRTERGQRLRRPKPPRPRPPPFPLARSFASLTLGVRAASESNDSSSALVVSSARFPTKIFSPMLAVLLALHGPAVFGWLGEKTDRPSEEGAAGLTAQAIDGPPYSSSFRGAQCGSVDGVAAHAGGMICTSSDRSPVTRSTVSRLPTPAA